MFDKNGHTMCLDCNGTGMMCGDVGDYTCTVCGGCGYLDWIEVIMGKPYCERATKTVYGIDILKAEGKIK